MKAMYLVAALVLAIVLVAGGCYGGTVYAQSQSQNNASAFLRQRGSGGSGQFNRQGTGQGTAQFGQLLARGQVKSVNGNTIEISTAQSVVTVQVNGQTVISKTDPGSLSDLQPGDRVTVFTSTTGNSVASAIQIQGAPAAQ